MIFLNFLNRIFLVVFSLFFVIGSAYTQDQTLQRNKLTKDSINTNLLVVSFPPNYYASDLERLYGEENDLNYKEAKELMLSAFFKSLHYTAQVSYNLDVLHWNNTERFEVSMLNTKILSKHLSTEPENLKKKSALKKKIVPESNDVTHLDDGQIKTDKQNVKLHLIRELINEFNLLNLIDPLNENKVDFVIFLNGLNAKKESITDVYSESNKAYDILLELHFSIYNIEGVLIKHGIVTEKVPASETRLSVIAGSYFNTLNEKMLLTLE